MGRKKSDIKKTTHESLLKYAKEYREKNKDKISNYMKEYNKTRYTRYHGDKNEYNSYMNNYMNEYIKRRCESDPLYSIRRKIKITITTSLKKKSYTKNSRTYEILGCSYEEFKIWIENKFTEGMSWENYGKWHYDHIIPISSALSEEECIRLNHYTNFQPLWAADNIRKSNKLL